MAGIQPPRGKAASLAVNERTSTPRTAAPKKVPLPPSLDPAHDRRFNPSKIQPPPSPARSARVNTASAKPGNTPKGSRQSYKPFFKGQQPARVEVHAVRGGHPQRRPVYEIGAASPGQNPNDVLSFGQEGQAAQIRQEDIGTPGVIFRDTATSLVPKTFVDIGAGRKVHVEQVAKDFANAALNFTPGPGQLAGAVAIGARGTRMARAFVKAASEGKSLGEAAVVASTVKTAGRAAKRVQAVERDVMPALRKSEARAQMHAEIDASLPRPAAEKVKASLDDAAVAHAHAVAQERTVAAKAVGGKVSKRDARQAGAHEFYDTLHSEIARPVPGAPRTFAQAKVRLDSLNRQIDAFIEKASATIGHPTGMTDAQLRAEQLARNQSNAKYHRQQAGVTRSGKRSGASGPKVDYQPLVSREMRDHAEKVIDKVVAAHPEIPEFRAYARLRDERDQLAAAVAQHQENALGGVQMPVDFGLHPEAAPVVPAEQTPAAVEPLPASTGISAEAPAVGAPAQPPVPPAEPVPVSSAGGGPSGDMFALEQGGQTALPTGAGEASFDPAVTLAEHRADEAARLWQSDIRRQMELDFNPPPDHAGYQPRTLQAGDLTVQIPKARSKLTQYVIEGAADRASRMLDKTVARDIPGARLLTSTERAVKGAGRLQRQEAPRRVAKVAREIRAVAKIKEGSPEDVATFWYAQLPDRYRNAQGLQLIRDMQAKELEKIVSGQARAALDAREQALRVELADAQNGDHFAILRQLDEIPRLREDLPFRVEDITASIGALDKLVADAPKVNRKALASMRTLAQDRLRILVDGNRITQERAIGRESLLANELGIPADGTEIYVGHRLPRPESFRGSMAPSGGTGRVASPQGVGSRNELVLARNGRLRASTRIAYEDWQSAQVFEQANKARDDLGKMGVPFRGGNLPEGHVLVNPRGETVPPHWKTDELSQFADDVPNEQIREKAKDVLQGFVADSRADAEEMVRLAYEKGQSVGDLRVVPKRLVDRYYSQFRSFKGRTNLGSAYDMAVDAVSTSIIFFRVGYIPKNVVQNIVMAAPHQGAFLLVNAARSAQALADPELRALLAGEVAGSSATAALSQERTVKKGFSAITHFVTNVADEPLRVAAFLHEAAAEGVISRYSPLLGHSDRKRLIKLLTDKSQRARLNDIRSRAVDAMGDFTRMTPDQARVARRLLVIPGWLMAGSRYPFHFAATHPVRSALLAYIALGEPNAPDKLRFNDPVWTYFHGHSYLSGLDTPWGRFRTSSLNPISTPFDLAKAILGSVQGKKGPFDYNTPTAFDEAQPFLKATVNSLQGAGVLKALEQLVPDYKFIRGLIDPKPTTSYPGDATWQGRLEREFGIIPIPVGGTNAGPAQGGPQRAPRKPRGGGSGLGGSSGGFGGGTGGGFSSSGGGGL